MSALLFCAIFCPLFCFSTSVIYFFSLGLYRFSLSIARPVFFVSRTSPLRPFVRLMCLCSCFAALSALLFVPLCLWQKSLTA